MNSPIKMRVQTKASKLGLARCTQDEKMGGIVAETKPGKVFVLPDEDGTEVHTNRIRSLSWERMLELLNLCQIKEGTAGWKF